MKLLCISRYLLLSFFLNLKKKFIYLLLLQREEGRKHLCVVPLSDAFVGWFLYVPWLGIEPIVLAYRDNVLTNRATPPGPQFLSILWISHSHTTQFINTTKTHQQGKNNYSKEYLKVSKISFSALNQGVVLNYSHIQNWQKYLSSNVTTLNNIKMV